GGCDAAAATTAGRTYAVTLRHLADLLRLGAVSRRHLRHVPVDAVSGRNGRSSAHRGGEYTGLHGGFLSVQRALPEGAFLHRARRKGHATGACGGVWCVRTAAAVHLCAIHAVAVRLRGAAADYRRAGGASRGGGAGDSGDREGAAAPHGRRSVVRRSRLPSVQSGGSSSI